MATWIQCVLVPLPWQTGRGIMYTSRKLRQSVASLGTNVELGLSESVLIEGPICYVEPSLGSVATKSHVRAKIMEEQKY